MSLMRSITIGVEPPADFDETALLATEAFEAATPFDAKRLRAIYQWCFGPDTKMITLRDQGRKVGQIVMLRHVVMASGKPEAAGQLIDFLLLKQYRSLKYLRMLYGEAERLAMSEGCRFLIGMPNAKARKLNERFMKARTALELPVRIGLALPRPWNEGVRSWRLTGLTAGEALAILAPFATGPSGNGLAWSAAGLYDRLRDNGFDYGLHVRGGLMAISSRRRFRGMDMVLIVAWLVRDGAAPTAVEVRRLTRAACGFWRLPLFVQCGHHRALPKLPGVVAPRWLKTTPVIVQFRDLQDETSNFTFDRFQLIDSDFA